VDALAADLAVRSEHHQVGAQGSPEDGRDAQGTGAVVRTGDFDASLEGLAD